MIKKLFIKIPIIGGCVTCKLEAHVQALIELLATQLFASTPVWLGAFVVTFFNTSSEQELSLVDLYIQNIINIIINGELYIYCMSVVAPIFYLALNYKVKNEDFPGRMGHVILVVLLMFVVVVIFVAQRTGGIIQPSYLFYTSIVLYVISLVMLYSAQVYNHNRMMFSLDDLRSGEQNLTKRLSEDIGSGNV